MPFTIYKPAVPIVEATINSLSVQIRGTHRNMFGSEVGICLQIPGLKFTIQSEVMGDQTTMISSCGRVSNNE